jgi:glycosyltransferase involved in cell wall biosynthesis
VPPPAPPEAVRPRRGRALLSYLPEPCGWAEDDPRLRGHSNKWESRELARQVFLAGFEVETVDFRDLGFVPARPYDLVIDIDKNLGRLAPLLPPGALRLLHMTGGYGPVANAAERTRLEALRRRRGLSLAPRRQVPDLDAVARSLAAADRCSLLGNAATLSTYPGDVQARTTLLPATASFLGASAKGPDELVPPGREFLYFAGSGAVHKGLDLVLEAFERLPGWRLHVVAPIGGEEDFLLAYRRELVERPEVTLHGPLDPVGPAFAALVRRCFAVLQPSCSEGQSTSVLTCMRAGLIPIVSREAGVDVPDGAGLVLHALGVGEVEAAVREAAAMDDAAVRHAAGRAQLAAEQRHGRAAFSAAVAAYLADVLAHREALLAARQARAPGAAGDGRGVAARRSRPPVSVVVPLRDAGPAAARCLTALGAALTPEDELVVTGATDGAALLQLVGAPGGRRVVSAPGGALDEAAQAGLAAAARELVVLLHPAETMPDGLIDELGALLAAHRELDLLAFPAPPAGLVAAGRRPALQALGAASPRVFFATDTAPLLAAAKAAGLRAAVLG